MRPLGYKYNSIELPMFILFDGCPLIVPFIHCFFVSSSIQSLLFPTFVYLPDYLDLYFPFCSLFNLQKYNALVA